MTVTTQSKSAPSVHPLKLRSQTDIRKISFLSTSISGIQCLRLTAPTAGECRQSSSPSGASTDEVPSLHLSATGTCFTSHRSSQPERSASRQAIATGLLFDSLPVTVTSSRSVSARAASWTYVNTNLISKTSTLALRTSVLESVETCNGRQSSCCM